MNCTYRINLDTLAILPYLVFKFDCKIGRKNINGQFNGKHYWKPLNCQFVGWKYEPHQYIIKHKKGLVLRCKLNYFCQTEFLNLSELFHINRVFQPITLSTNIEVELGRNFTHKCPHCNSLRYVSWMTETKGISI